MENNDFRFEVGNIVTHILCNNYRILILSRKVDIEGWIQGNIYDCRVFASEKMNQFIILNTIIRFHEMELTPIGFPLTSRELHELNLYNKENYE